MASTSEYESGYIAGKFFTSINPHYRSFRQFPIPDSPPQSPPSVAYLKDKLYNRGWLTEQLFIQAFIPREFCFRGPLFSRLSYFHDTLPITKTERGWSLSYAVKSDWRSLSFGLDVILRHMSKLIARDYPTPFGWWAGPWSCDYGVRVASEGIARRNAMASRDMFRALIGKITYSYIALECLARRDLNFDWRKQLIEMSNVHPAWLWELENSIAFSLDVPRFGGVLDYNSPLCRYIDIFLAINAPIQICWGEYFPARVHPALKRYLPTPQAFKAMQSDPYNLRISIAAYAPPEISGTNIADGYELPPSSSYALAEMPKGSGWNIADGYQLPPPSTYSGPALPKNSRQKPGESRDDFFARIETIASRALLNESPKDRQARLQRETHAQRMLMPSKANVFIWERINGYDIRRPQGAGTYHEVWGKFTDRQKRYTSYFNEWDLCVDFAPDDCSRLDDEDPDDDWDPYDTNPDIDMNILSKDDLRRTFGQYETGPVEFARHKETVSDIVMFRWGLDPTQTPAPVIGTLGWEDCMEACGCKRSQLSLGDTPKESIKAFFEHIRTNPRIGETTTCWDLKNSISAASSTQWNISLRGRIESDTDTPSLRYVIRPKSTGISVPSLEVIVNDPVSVLEIIRRQWGPDVSDVARELAAQCSSFVFAYSSPRIVDGKPRSPVNLHTWRGLGYRKPGYVPDRYDYDSYVALRDEFFRSPRGRLALREGGLISRLAMDSLDPEEYSTLSVAEIDSGTVEFVSRADIRRYDALSQTEIELICGVYYLDTGSSKFVTGAKIQTSKKSYWPIPDRFLSSPVWPGFWSPDCEHWYNNNLQKLQASDPPLKSSQEWKQFLKLSSKVSNLHKSHRIAAQEFLATRSGLL